MIKTERLKIYPASKAEAELLVSMQTDVQLKRAYTQMLNLGLEFPELWQWYAPWIISKKDGSNIGDLSFKGISSDGSVEIGYLILTEYQNKGYATEAVKAAVRWAISQPNIKRVIAQVHLDNMPSQKVLIKSGFENTEALCKEGIIFIYKGEAFNEQS